MQDRLQKVLAEYGVGSRRKCEELILEGKIKVNGIIISKLGIKVDKNKDIIEYEGKVLENQKKVYLLLNKPTGYITSVKDQFNRSTVINLIKDVDERIYPVGRLDYDTEGLLLLTNDGDLAYKLTHPKHDIDKTYIAVIKGILNDSDIIMFQKGIDIGGYITAPAKIKQIKKMKDSSIVQIVIHEGKNRQIRRMCQAINHDVIRLRRIKIGKIDLGNLKVGEYRTLTNEEIDYLKKIGGEYYDKDAKTNSITS